MAGQSLAMGEAFGKGFQYGKRKISSMTNEEFNALDFKGLSESIATDYKDMIPSMEQSIRNSDVLQSAVIQEMGDLIKSIPSEILNFLGSLTGGPTQTAGGPAPITNVRLNRNQDIQADRDRIANDLAEANRKLLEFTHGVLTAETLADAKRRAEEKARQDKIKSQVKVETGRSGNKRFTIINPSIETSTATKITPSSTRVPVDTRRRPPSSLVTQLRKHKEEVRVAAIKYQTLTSRSGLSPATRQRYNLLYKVGPRQRLSAFLNKYNKIYKLA